MWAVLRFWMYSQVEASGVRKRFCDCAFPEICNGPNRSVAPAWRGDTPSPPATNPARTVNHGGRYVMPPRQALVHAALQRRSSPSWLQGSLAPNPKQKKATLASGSHAKDARTLAITRRPVGERRAHDRRIASLGNPRGGRRCRPQVSRDRTLLVHASTAPERTRSRKRRAGSRCGCSLPATYMGTFESMNTVTGARPRSRRASARCRRWVHSGRQAVPGAPRPRPSVTRGLARSHVEPIRPLRDGCARRPCGSGCRALRAPAPEACGSYAHATMSSRAVDQPQVGEVLHHRDALGYR